MQNKYLIFREKPYNRGETIAQVDVSHLNKRGVNAEWDRLTERFPLDKYQSALMTTKETLPTFIKE